MQSNRPLKNDRAYRKPFTLIELLVVVSIIAILASILLPALSKARERALRTKCMGHMKQLGAAFYLYSSEFDGAMAPTNLLIKYRNWSNALVDGGYVQSKPAGWTGYTQPAEKGWFKTGIMVCPVAARGKTFSGLGGSYGVSIKRYQHPSISNKYIVPKISAQEPSKLLLGETRDHEFSAGPGENLRPSYMFHPPNFGWGEGNTGYAQSSRFRHANTQSNVCFMDGHMEVFTYDELRGNVGSLF